MDGQASTPGNTLSSSAAGAQAVTGEKTYFEKQRDALVSEISVSLEHVLTNINTLNRALEGVIVVGKEFESVSTLWSTFYDGMAHEGHEENDEEEEEEEEEELEGGDHRMAD
ncbi:DASH complex subunit Dad1-domain-containing protein [Kockiozyma suomiensis]|uniref:DASH complex subunit Dad1-domain-containing protein n=1 Tax=Kockiozyma suomiensis TaxID=1337062 RepID=UPI003343BD16